MGHNDIIRARQYVPQAHSAFCPQLVDAFGKETLKSRENGPVGISMQPLLYSENEAEISSCLQFTE